MGRFINKTTQLQLRRLLRRRRRATEETVKLAAEHIDKDFIGRFSRVMKVKRFTFGWLALVLLLVITTILQTVALSSAYQTKQFIDGGSYHEGIVGTFSTANPLYATGAVDTAVSRLIFAGLFKYDKENHIEGDLASDYSVDATGKVYTVHLRKGLHWHDGKPLTADDVVFTFRTMQNPDARSVLQGSMRGVSIDKLNDNTITFKLSSALSSFPGSLTVGLLPQHILGKVTPSELRASSFNTAEPVGSGPFMWQQLQLSTTSDSTGEGTAATITLERFEHYHEGSPKLNRFSIHTYETTDDLLGAFDRREVTAIAGLKSAPRELQDKKDIVIQSFQSTAAMMTFFNTQSASAVNDVAVRRGLMYATGRRAIIQKLDQSLKIVQGPMLTDQFAYDKTYAQPLYNKAKAEETLTQAGWIPGKDGIRVKDAKRLSINLYAEDTHDNRIVTDELKRQWRDVGAEANVTLQPSMYFQITLQTRGYDAVIHGISIGIDPDVYAYWHSSQATGGGMNLSNYKSSVADKSLEAGRTRQDEAQRALKYKPFLKAWLEDVPAIGMFRPRIYYVTRGPVYGLDEHLLNTDADRYYSVEHWQIRTAYVNDN